MADRSRPSVALDLDGTLVFPSPAEIEIPGRTRCSYLSQSVADQLARLSQRADVYIATARHARNVRQMMDRLPGFLPAGFVCEGGLVARRCLDDALNAASADFLQERDDLALRLRLRFPAWDWIAGYEMLIGCVAPESVSDPVAEIKTSLSDNLGCIAWRFVRERHKTFLYPAAPCKWTGLKNLGVTQLDAAAGDDPVYDGSMLDAAKIPMTIGAEDSPLAKRVTDRAGLLFQPETRGGHDAARRMLDQMLEIYQSGVRSDGWERDE